MSVLIRQLLGILLLAMIGFQAQAAEVWFYEWRDPQTLSAHQSSVFGKAGDKHWVLTEFTDDPFPGQLGLLKTATGFQKITLLFHRSPAPALADDYADVAQGLTARGIAIQLKFSGTLPTEDEARILKRACDAGAKVTYVTNTFPSTYETKNLLSLGDCVDVQLVLGHYPKYDEINDFKGLAGLKLTLVNNYFPQYAHMDALNILGLPVAIHVTDGVPALADLTFINAIKPLTSFGWEMTSVPDSSVYGLLEKLDRKGGARHFNLRWVYGDPSDSDVEAWLRLGPDRMQLGSEAFTKFESRLRPLPGEVLVETFQLD